MTHELELVEVGDDRRHHEREHAFSGELARGRPGGGLQIGVVELEAHLAELLGEPTARACRVVGDEAQLVSRTAELGDRVGRSGDRLPRDVEDAVDVEQNARHGA